MPRRPRLSSAGLVFHIVNRAAKRWPLFEHASDYEAFERILANAATRFPVAVFAYCLMPNHWHLLVSPEADAALSRFMHWLTTTHARRWQTYRGTDGEGAVYQGRFKAIPVETDTHFLWVCRYIERNAARGALVSRAEEWPWSSLARRIEAAPTWLAEWPVPRPADWIAHVNMPQSQAEVEAFQRAMKRNEPFGDETWRTAVRARLGGPAVRRNRGRPRDK